MVIDAIHHAAQVAVDIDDSDKVERAILEIQSLGCKAIDKRECEGRDVDLVLACSVGGGVHNDSVIYRDAPDESYVLAYYVKEA